MILIFVKEIQYVVANDEKNRPVPILRTLKVSVSVWTLNDRPEAYILIFESLMVYNMHSFFV